jgi:DNA invertase Pin-like site-specific DNA recombinase
MPGAPVLDSDLEQSLVVWKLDRLSRSLRDLLDIIIQLHSLHVGFQSLTEKIDTPARAAS